MAINPRRPLAFLRKEARRSVVPRLLSQRCRLIAVLELADPICVHLGDIVKVFSGHHLKGGEDRSGRLGGGGWAASIRAPKSESGLQSVGIRFSLVSMIRARIGPPNRGFAAFLDRTRLTYV